MLTVAPKSNPKDPSNPAYAHYDGSDRRVAGEWPGDLKAQYALHMVLKSR
jgi:hypothetical protein